MRERREHSSRWTLQPISLVITILIARPWNKRKRRMKPPLSTLRNSAKKGRCVGRSRIRDVSGQLETAKLYDLNTHELSLSLSLSLSLHSAARVNYLSNIFILTDFLSLHAGYKLIRVQRETDNKVGSAKSKRPPWSIS